MTTPTTHRITPSCQIPFPCWLWHLTTERWYYQEHGFGEPVSTGLYSHFSTLPRSTVPEAVEPEEVIPEGGRTGGLLAEMQQHYQDKEDAPAPTQAVPSDRLAELGIKTIDSIHDINGKLVGWFINEEPFEKPASATPSPALSELAESAAREVIPPAVIFADAPEHVEDLRRNATAILLRTFGPAFEKVEGERDKWQSRATEMQVALGNSAESRARLETENAAERHRYSELHVTCTGLEKEADALGGENAALRADKERHLALLDEINVVLKQRAVGHTVLYSDRVRGFIERIDSARNAKEERG